MNSRRLITGLILSFAFLLFFTYTVFGVQQIFKNSTINQNSTVAIGDLSEGAKNIIPTNPVNLNEVISQIITAPKPEIIPEIKPVLAPKPDNGISAKSALSVESDLQIINKNIFEKNINAQLPIASLTKLMTAVIVLDNYNLSYFQKIDSIADSQDSMKQDLKLGDSMKVDDLLKVMLVESSNKSAYALSEVIGEEKFVAMMNQKAKDLGLENTYFVDPTGLDAGDVSTASDLSKLAVHILKDYPKIAQITQTKEIFIPGLGVITNTDQLLNEIPDIVCSKTGFTTAANGCLLLVINNPKNNDYLINIILGADDRFSEMKKLISVTNKGCQ